MRVSSNLYYNQLTQGLKNSLADLTTISNQLTTGKKINKPSDNVLGTMEALDYKLSISQSNQYEQNISQSINYLGFINTVFKSVATALTQLKKLTASGGTVDEQALYAQQAADQRDFLVDLSNSKLNDSYVFSGFASTSKPYLFDDTGGVPTYHYIYQGDGGQVSLPINKSMTQPINVVGSSEFSSLTTAFSYTLSAPETLTLSDGSTVTYTAVPDALHKQTAIQVDLSHPDHPGDPAYTDSFTFSNFMDLANQLNHAWQNQNVDGTALSQTKAQRRIEALADPLDKAQTQVLLVQAELGTREAILNDQKSSLDAKTLTQQNNLSEIQDADMNETIVSLQKITTTLNALRSASAKILSQSLFDFLR